MRGIKIIILFAFLSVGKKSLAQDTLRQPVNDSVTAVLIDTVPASKDTAINSIKDSTNLTPFDSLPVSTDTLVKRKKHNPHKATIRSAIIPGWGQAYNREYWKIPIVYGALAVPAVTYVYNDKWYKKTRDAYNIVVNEDTGRYNEIDRKLFDADGKVLDATSLQYYRNQFRRDRDYSVLYFLIIWGINVVDATVFGHLKDFDVSDELSMRIKPGFDPFTKTGNVGFAFNFKTAKPKPLPAF